MGAGGKRVQTTLMPEAIGHVLLKARFSQSSGKNRAFAKTLVLADPKSQTNRPSSEQFNCRTLLVVVGVDVALNRT